MSNYCFFNTVKAWGGGEKWHLEVASYLHEKGENVIVVAAPHSPLSEKAIALGITVKTIRLSNLSFLNPVVLIRIAYFLKRNKVKSLVMNSPRDLKSAGIASKLIKAPLIIFRRGSDIPVKNNLLNRFLYQRVVHKVLVNSAATKASLNKNNKDIVPDRKIHLVPNGIDSKIFLESKTNKLYERQGDEFILCTLGRLVAQKNHSFLLNLAVELKQRGVCFKLIIGGAGPLEKALKESAREKMLLKEVLFLGFIEESKNLYNSADIFVLSSLWEGFGYVLAEASLCELPCVAFDLSSNAQIIQDGKTGLLVPEGDVNRFADAIEKLCKNEHLRKEMGKEAKRFVKNNFEATDIFDKLEAVIRPK
jgi:glycosyltransferase involved in cell wall biosynthesis